MMKANTPRNSSPTKCDVNAIAVSQHDALHLAIESMAESVIVLDPVGNVVYINQATTALIGHRPYSVTGKQWLEVVPLLEEESLKPMINIMEQCLYNNDCDSTGANALLELRSGRRVHVEYRVSPIHSETNQLCGVVLTLRDISNTRQLVTTLLYQATHDALTRLVNRREFEQRLARVLTNTSEHNAHALIFMDLDGFKKVNDTHGHAAGDEILRQVARVLASGVRERDTLARLGGDEFALLLEHCSSSQALKTAKHLKELIAEHFFIWQGHEFRLDISIGVTPLTEQNLQMECVMAAADIACYVSKKTGNGPVHSDRHSPLSAKDTHNTSNVSLINKNTLRVNIGHRFDISHFGTFAKLCDLIKSNDITKLEMDLTNTMYLHDFGMALLLMLTKQKATLRDGIYIINCNKQLMPRFHSEPFASAFQFPQEQTASLT